MEEVFKSIIEHGAKNMPLENEECCICYEESTYRTNCMHNICLKCLPKIDQCPLCRKEIILCKRTTYFKMEQIYILTFLKY